MRAENRKDREAAWGYGPRQLNGAEVPGLNRQNHSTRFTTPPQHLRRLAKTRPTPEPEHGATVRVWLEVYDRFMGCSYLYPADLAGVKP
jgi:hypothetical protein